MEVSETMADEYSEESKPQGVKRTQDASDGPANKKAHFGQEEEGGGDHLAIKILIPSNAVGAIIGKGGEAMRNLKNDNNCRVQMSKNSETYPGTSERICLVKGRLNNIMAVIESIQEKIREKCADQTGTDAFDHKNTSRGAEIKIVMPNTSAGMVIGKSGANIKDIREQFGCQIQVYPKAGSVEAKTSLERVVTVAHEEMGALVQAAARVLEKVASDPHHSSEINKEDFGKGSGPGPQGSGPSGPGGGPSQNAPFSSTPAFNGSSMNVGSAGFGPSSGGYGGGGSQFGGPGGGFGNGNPNKYPMSGLGNNELLSFLDNLQSTLRTSGFNEQSVSEVMQAMQVLAKYNIMGLGLGLGVAAMAQMRTGQESGMSSNHGSAGFGDGYGGPGGPGGPQGGPGGPGGPQGGGPGGDQSYWRR